MKITVILALLSIGAMPAHETIVPSSSGQSARVGINLGAHSSASPHILFVDAMMRAQPWTPFTANNEAADTTIPVPLRDDGMPIRVPFNSPSGTTYRVRTQFYEKQHGHYPSGDYVVSFEGKGKVIIRGDPGNHVFTRSGRYPLKVTPRNKGWVVEIHESSEEDPIRNLHVWLPGFENAKQLIHPLATYRLKGFSTLRTAQSMALHHGRYPCRGVVEANDPKCVHSWEDRPTPNYYTQYRPQGLALEYIIDLANQTGANLWPGIPHAADDEWIRNAARVIRDQLRPDQKVFVELSDEVWNSHSSYPQHYYFREAGRRGKLFSTEFPGDEYELGRRAFVQRSVQVFSIFEEVFGQQAPQRLIKVMPALFTWPAVAESLLKNLRDPVLNPKGIKVDALAVGAYFGTDAVKELLEERQDEPLTVSMLVNRIVQSIGTKLDGPLIETFSGFTKAHALLAKQHDLQLVAYDGGLVLDIEGLSPNSPIHKLLSDTHRDPRMAQIYQQMFSLWSEAGGGQFIAHTFARRPSPKGSLGHLEHIFQPLEEAPTFAALRTQMGKAGQKMLPPVNKANLAKYIAKWRSPLITRSIKASSSQTADRKRVN